MRRTDGCGAHGPWQGVNEQQLRLCTQTGAAAEWGTKGTRAGVHRTLGACEVIPCSTAPASAPTNSCTCVVSATSNSGPRPRATAKDMGRSRCREQQTGRMGSTTPPPRSSTDTHAHACAHTTPHNSTLYLPLPPPLKHTYAHISRPLHTHTRTHDCTPNRTDAKKTHSPCDLQAGSGTLGSPARRWRRSRPGSRPRPAGRARPRTGSV